MTQYYMKHSKVNHRTQITPHSLPCMWLMECLLWIFMENTTETERWSGRLPWSSLEKLKASFNVPSNNQGSHPDNLSVLVTWLLDVMTYFCIIKPQWVNQFCHHCLTHWGRDEMDNISQTTFSNVFSSMKMFEFRLKFHWSLFPRVQSTIFQPWLR